jgi:endonuclease/exonuclease/phosphatase family metal-dependent hydrolase
MNIRRFLSVVALAFCSVANCAAQTAETGASVIPLKILSYNVHLLPDIAARVAGKRSNSDYRAEEIGKQSVGYDIIGLSETFDQRRAKKLLKALEDAAPKTYVYVKGPKRSGPHFTSSGLLLISRFPIEETHEVRYSDASWFLDSGFKADGFAAKGALHARIRVSDKPRAVVDCFLTHLESRDPEAREKQIVELAGFMAQHVSAENPVIAMGDFNVGANTGERDSDAESIAHHEFLRSRLVHSGTRLVDTWEKVGRGSPGTNDPLADSAGRRIDYIFMSDTASARNQLRPLGTAALPFADAKVKEGSLSDHLGVECQAELVISTSER